MTTDVLEKLPRVRNGNKRDGQPIPCTTQKEIAAQTSYVETAVARANGDKSEKVYTAPCMMTQTVKVAGRD